MWGESLVLVACWLLLGAHAHYFQPGFQYHYTYTARNALQNQAPITTILKFHITPLYSEGQTQRLHSMAIDSYVQFRQGGQVHENPGNWDLSKSFLFVTNANGSVALVHRHPEDRHELVVVKKAIVSIFSVHLQTETDQNSWQYSVEETDHLGRLQHDYAAEKTARGLKLQRTHTSMDKAHRSHDKTLHYDHEGVLLSAEAKDRVILQDQSGGIVRSKPLPGQTEDPVTSSGKFPDIDASANVTVTFTGKRPTADNLQDHRKHMGKLQSESLENKPKPEPTLRMKDIQRNITAAFNCIHHYRDPKNENRTICINKLRSHLKSLSTADYHSFTTKLLARNCSANDSLCEDDRLVVLDLVARMGDITSQKILMTYVLSRHPPVEEELRRVFIHCVALKSPTWEFVTAIGNFCFGKDGEHHGSRTLNRTQGRACLAVGSLIKQLASNGENLRAELLAKRLETWLEEHGKGDSWLRRRGKRDTEHAWTVENSEDENIVKAILLHALGNGALYRSRQHLLKHAQPNSGHHMWRRAALDSLRHYSCEESAQALFNSVMHDDIYSVRRVAVDVFMKHRRRRDVTRKEEDVLLGEKYTYETVARVKRNVFEKVLFQFKLALPRYEWTREVGTSSIGASFGVKFQNSIEGMFHVLQGYVDIDVDDKLFAEMHIGLIGYHLDLLGVKACYRGRLSYNMNIIKDWTVGLYKDISSSFDHIINRLMQPMEDFILKVGGEYQEPETDTPKSAFESLADAVKNMPELTGDALDAVNEFSQAADLLGAMPIINKLQGLALRAATLMEDVHSETAELFTNIADVAVVALPYSEKEIRSSLNSVIDVVDKVKDYPNQAFSVMEGAKLRYQLAMMRVLEGSKILKQAFRSVSGGRSSWNSASEEIRTVIDRTKSLISELRGDSSRRRKRQAEDLGLDGYSQCATANGEDAVDDLVGKGEAMVGELEIVLNTPAQLQQAMDKMQVHTEILKAGFESFKEAIDMIKARIHALFGLRFHPSFPNQRRNCDDHCGCGYFPTDCTRYGHPGIDLVWNEGWRVTSPVTGMVYVEPGSGAVVIEPETSEFLEYQIHIANIRLHSNYTHETEFFIEAGQVFAYSNGSSGCNKDHIHVAVWRTSNETDLCHYVDPSPFLDTMQPIPTWHEECREFKAEHAFDTVDFSKLTSGYQDFIYELRRFALEISKDMAIHAIKNLVPDDTLLAPFKGLAQKFVQNVNTSAGDLENLFTPGWDAAEHFYHEIKQNFTFKGLLDMAGDSNILKEHVPQLRNIARAARAAIKIPKNIEKLTNLTVGSLGRMWNIVHSGNFSFPAFQSGDFSQPLFQFGDFSLPSLNFTGLHKLVADVSQSFDQRSFEEFLASGRDGLVMTLQSTMREATCPITGKLLARQGSPCIPTDDCRGLSCDINIKSKHLTGKIAMDVKIDTGSKQVTITGDVDDFTVTGDDDQTVFSGLTLFGTYDVMFRLITFWQEDDLELTLILEACGPDLCCLPENILINNITFSEVPAALGGLFNGLYFDVDFLPLDESYKVFTDLNIDSPELTNQILGMKDIISDSLGVKLPDNTRYYVEFKNPVDYKDSGSFPLAGQNAEVYIPLVDFALPFPLGPVIFTVRFSGGASVGLAFDISVQALDSSVIKTRVAPWVSAKMEAGFSVSIFVFGFGADLHGWIMRTRFPLSLESHYSKQPIVQKKTLVVELIPLELMLKLWVEIKLEIGWGWFKIRLFKKRWTWTVWHWRSRSLSGTVWEKVDYKNDLRPPRFPYCDSVDAFCARRRRRSIGGGPPTCSVKQLTGRHPKDTAFKLDFSVYDEDSDVTVSYAVGDYPGGTNVAGWTRTRGVSYVVPDKFPCGKRLYFSVRAVNSQGQSVTAQCSLPTYDCSFPDGRVDADYRCTSHPGKLSATVIVYEDSKLERQKLFHSVGYSPSSQGHEVVNWLPLKLSGTVARSGFGGDLRYFTPPRVGRLAATPMLTLLTSFNDCVFRCRNDTTCVAFSYSRPLSSCELQNVAEGVHAKRTDEQHYSTYEKLGIGHSAKVQYEDVPLRHGAVYFVNAVVENVLGYKSVLTSQGTMVDRTPPEPGFLGVGAVDTMVADKCAASVGQRCVDVVDTPNHRKITDGKGGSTVFNGNRRGQDLIYTIENHHAAANWAGFKDPECGLHQYLWGVGTSVCGTQIANFTDPHKTMHHQQDWTNIGLAKGLHLAEGNHFVTVQAISDIVHGGDLVTTVCHSQPFIVDISPPIVHGVNEVLFDDTFRFLAVYYNATDNLSGISRVEFGLGRTKYDVLVRKYMPFEMRGTGSNTFLLNEEFETASGVPSWARIKAVDKVGLSATGFGDTPILIDSTPPITGEVLDGSKIGRDVCCQDNSSVICAQWRKFEDPESHIHSFLWGVGTAPGKDDVVTFQRKSSHDRQACESGLQLEHNTTYYSTVVVYNKALNQKSSNTSSDGVLVDLTPPVAGVVVDGDNITTDVNFTSETASLSSAWQGFYDPETQIESYTLSMFVNDKFEKEFADLAPDSDQFTDHSFSLQHGDKVHTEVTATNRAGATVTVASDGMTVDHTPPALIALGTAAQMPFQQEDDFLSFLWEFEDPESGLTEFRYTVFQVDHGRRTRFWPADEEGEMVKVLNGSQTNASQALTLDDLLLMNGASYSVKVTAINGAKMAAVEESASVTIDKTPPVLEQLHVAMLGEEEEVNEDGEVEHIKGEPLHITWVAYDFESGLTDAQICIGPVGTDCLSSGMSYSVEASPNNMFTTVLNDTNLAVSTETGKVAYQVSLLVTNGAGVKSTSMASKPIIVLQGNIAGAIHDGRTGEDEDFTNDKASVAVTFAGFSSQACGIEEYEWGVGTTPCATDILPYSRVGLVVDPDTEGAGKAQAHVMLREGQTYYAAVRARTGHNCHEPYIVSCSDGITVDTFPPQVSFHKVPDTRSSQSLAADPPTLTTSDVVYEAEDNVLSVGWRVEDPSGINSTSLTLDRWGSDPDYTSVAAVSLQPYQLGYQVSSGQSIFPALSVSDAAGNEAISPLPPAVYDFTPPWFVDLRCTDMISVVSSQITCTWTAIEEWESTVKKVEFGLGSSPALADIYGLVPVSLNQKHWTVEVNLTSQDNFAEYYINIALASNTVGLVMDEPMVVTVDATPPAVSGITIVTSSEPGGSLAPRRCQSSQDFVEVHLTGVSDAESGIERVEIALGSSPGTSDIQGFEEFTQNGNVYARGQLGLAAGTTVFATARITNGVGLYTVISSDGVVVSPSPYLEVWDGQTQQDMDGMADMNTIQGQWRLSDPCPIIKSEWAVTELSSGRYIRDFTPIPANGHFFYDDTLALENFKTYVSHVRVTDAQNRVFTGYSDGVTVSVQPPDTAAVWEGSGHDDQDYQVSLHELVASWDPFGDSQSPLPSQQILRYEVAVGTDRRWPITRTNIHGFQDVGLALTHTFHGLNLTAKTVPYYITVRAYSAANTFSESSSDGVRAGYSGEITPGSVRVDPYQSYSSRIRAPWEGFISDMGEMRYYLGVSSAIPPWDNSTYDCEDLFNTTFQFDVRSPQPVSSQSLAYIKNLQLRHKGTYFVTVVAEDLMLHCAAAVSGPIVVDTTPPEKGELDIVGFDSGEILFVHSADSITVNLNSFVDAESGIKKVSVELTESRGCGTDDDGEIFLDEAKASGPYNVTIRNLNLQLGKVYNLWAAITNGAALTMKASRSKPVMLDAVPPRPGTVKVGTRWTSPERLYQSQTHTLEGMIAVVPFDSSIQCDTQVDLMSHPHRDSWEAVQGSFSPDCSFVEDSAISVLVQHNPGMTDVDKGALQVQDLMWREGDYTFRMAPAAGQNILTGISLASPALQPPFLSQNGIPLDSTSAWICDSTSSGCNIGSRNESAKRSLIPEEEYGTGLSFLEINGTMKGLFWAQDHVGLKQTVLPFDSDPAAMLADYVFRVKELEGESVEITLLVNGKIRAAFSGLTFPANMTLNIYTWNVNNYMPPVDPFQPFRTVAEVTNVAIPVAGRPLCSYGTPFHDSHSGVKEVWVGVSSSLNETANIVPFRQVESFCTPCLLGCSNLCSKTCSSTSNLSSDYNILSVTLGNLTLESGAKAAVAARESLSQTLNNTASDHNTTTGDELEEFSIPQYYLDVRVIAQSGLFADAKSSPVVVDTSPPIVSEIFCIDPLYSLDEPVEFVGSNDTVGLKWDVSEDVTNVASQWISVGSEPHLDDIVPWTKVDRHAKQHIQKDLKDLLEDDTTYSFNVRVVNQAGLSANASVNFTVLISPPDMSVLSPSLGNVTAVLNISDQQVAVTESTDTVTVFLHPSAQAANSSVEFIEWTIGTKHGSQNIFPKTIVANPNVTEIAIVNGHLVIGGSSTNISVGDYARSNFASSGGGSERGAMFKMEPGRCLHQQVMGVTKAHREGIVDMAPLFMLRQNDTLVQPGQSKLVLSMKNSSADGSQDSQDIEVDMKVGKGGVAVGVLSDSDMDAQYGTAASTDFSPYIVRPDPQGASTTRFLRGRWQSAPGPNLYLAPAPSTELDGDIDIIYNVSSSVPVPPDATVMLIYWDADSRQWKSLQDACSTSSQTFNSTSGELVGKVCPRVFADPNENRVKRSVPVTGDSPRMVTVAVVTATMVNAPPSIHNLSVVLHEDSDGYTTTITYTDDEDDDLEFSILHQPQNGAANVTPTGQLTYKPDPNFFGQDVIVLQATEVLDEASLAAGSVANVVNVSVVVTVTGRNDPPQLFYLPGTNDSNVTPELLVGPAAGNGINVSVLVEGNTTTSAELGLIVFGDIDANDDIILISQVHGDEPYANLSARDVSLQDERLSEYGIIGASRGAGAKEISLSLIEGFHGSVSYEARAQDSANTYSLLLTVGVHVMISPCIHGHCQARTPGETCADWRRAHSFDPFLCHCDPGYEGQWCSIDTDECLTATCSPVTDCVDLVNGYRCDPNLEKTLAIAFCSLVAVLLVAAVIYKLKKGRKKYDFNDDKPSEPPRTHFFFSSWPSPSPFAQDSAPTSSSTADITELDVISPDHPMPRPSRNIWRPLDLLRWFSREPAPDYPQRETFTTFSFKKGKGSKSTKEANSSDISGGTLHPPRRSSARDEAWPAPPDDVLTADNDAFLPVQGSKSLENMAASTLEPGEEHSYQFVNPAFSSTSDLNPSLRDGQSMIWRPMHSPPSDDVSACNAFAKSEDKLPFIDE